jgi:hypothetical protein
MSRPGGMAPGVREYAGEVTRSPAVKREAAEEWGRGGWS